MSKVFSGVALVGLSLFMALGFAKADIKSGVFIKALTFGLVVVLPLGGGAGLLYSHQRDRHRLQKRADSLTSHTLKSAILDLAQRSDGTLVLAEIVADLGISPDQTQQVLDALMADQLADLKVTDSGTLVYVFPELQALTEKASARSLLE